MNSTRIRFMTQLSLLFAVQIILCVTPLGYIPLGPIDITIMHIPVLVGAIVLGQSAGLILGTTFGITSILVATFRPTLGSFLFTPFYTGGNFYSIIIAMVPRILFGLLTACLFIWLDRTKISRPICAGIAAAAGSLCNTVLVMGGIYLFFGKEYADLLGVPFSGILAVIASVIVTNGIPEILAAVLLCTALVVPLRGKKQPKA